MSELEKYIRAASNQVEDDIVFPNQDWQTLLMNLQNALKPEETS